MLVLSRQRDETIMIGDVEVTVVDIRGDKVRLGVTAPRDVPIHRKEVYDAINRGEPKPPAGKVDRGAEVPVDVVRLSAPPMRNVEVSEAAAALEKYVAEADAAVTNAEEEADRRRALLSTARAARTLDTIDRLGPAGVPIALADHFPSTNG